MRDDGGPPPDGRALVRARVSEAATLLERALRSGEPACAWRGPAPRAVVTTGIGSSEAHARHLAALLPDHVRLPARFVETGRLARGAPVDAREDALVVFSQGLSPNARYALREAGEWRHAILVTGLPRPGASGFSDLPEGKRRWLEQLEEAGCEQLVLSCGEESGTLARVQGPRLGYLVAWSIVRALARRLRLEADSLTCDVPTLLTALESAAARAAERLRTVAPPDRFFARDRPLLLVAAEGYGELASHLALKLAEWTLRPPPPLVDALSFAHGPLQGVFGRPASILQLRPGAGPAGAGWQAAIAGAVDPEHHDLLVLDAELPEPFSVLEHEAMLDALLLAWLDTSDVDPSVWPGREREAALYQLTPGPPDEEARSATPGPLRLDDMTWPELDRARRAGLATALLPLGSTEQHGPHLPFATDTWIADALGVRLARRLGGAVALPALALGCASEHLAFPGTLHLEPGTLEAVLRDVIASLRAHGFERALVFSAHGGNAAPLRAMAPALREAARPLRLAVFSDLDSVAALQARASARYAVSAAAAGHHAGEFETSIVAGLRPGAVRVDRLEPGLLEEPADPQSLFHPSLREHAADGVVGDPRPARADRADEYLDAWVERLAAFYEAELAGAARPA